MRTLLVTTAAFAALVMIAPVGAHAQHADGYFEREGWAAAQAASAQDAAHAQDQTPKEIWATAKATTVCPTDRHELDVARLDASQEVDAAEARSSYLFATLGEGLSGKATPRPTLTTGRR
jgi:hypothetical protein